MELLHLRVFQRQVADQCRIVLTAVPVINKAATDGDQDSLWIGCQMFIVGAGNLSKAFWGDGQGRKKGHIPALRKPLRESLDVDDTSPLYELGLRNHFEHYDERIDRWWEESPSHNHLDRMIGPPSMVAGLSPIEMFRIYDPTTQSIVFWGERFDLQAVATEVDRIYPLARREAEKPHWQQ